MNMKRKGDSAQPLQSPNVSPKKSKIHESRTVLEQAEPYRLITAKLSIDHLDPRWQDGSNRKIDPTHKQLLREIFARDGLQRTAPANYLRVACSHREVDRMLEHLRREESGEQDSSTAETSWPSFLNWMQVNETKPVLIAGNHRVEALKDYLETIENSDDERWWICMIYDRDRLPLNLAVQLRANRETVTLPDSHGQIWIELLTLATNDPTLFQGPTKQVEEQMARSLSLNGRVSFPVRRLGTLWRNARWRLMITQWCEFPLGRDTFNLTVFEWMSSCRIDDFWSWIFDQVIIVLKLFRDQVHYDPSCADWTTLSKLPERWTSEDQQLFYPGLKGPVQRGRIEKFRDPDFLLSLSDAQYFHIFGEISNRPELPFPKIQSIFKLKVQDGKVMSTVMAHIGYWLSPHPFRSTNRSYYKPPLRDDFLPGLRASCGDDANQRSIELQQHVLLYVRDHLGSFTNPTIAHYLEEFPDTYATTYTERFQHTVWNDLLLLVFRFSGPHFQCSAMSRFNQEDVRKLQDRPHSIISQSMCHLLPKIPEISRNPALQNAGAMRDLMDRIQPLVLQWAVDQCQKACDNPEVFYPQSTLSLIQDDLYRYRRLMPSPVTAVEAGVQANREEIDITSPATEGRETETGGRLQSQTSRTPSITQRFEPDEPARDQARERLRPSGKLASPFPLSVNGMAKHGSRSTSSRTPRQGKLRRPHPPTSTTHSRSGRPWKNSPAVQLMNIL